MGWKLRESNAVCVEWQRWPGKWSSVDRCSSSNGQIGRFMVRIHSDTHGPEQVKSWIFSINMQSRNLPVAILRCVVAVSDVIIFIIIIILNNICTARICLVLNNDGRRLGVLYVYVWECLRQSSPAWIEWEETQHQQRWRQEEEEEGNREEEEKISRLGGVCACRMYAARVACLYVWWLVSVGICLLC